jgi:DNA-binding response OmpR family regulator
MSALTMVVDLGSRVLIADRDAAVRQTLFSRLLDLNLFSDCVSDGQDALEKLGEVAYTVVVIDVGLHGFHELGVLQKIAELAAGRRPVVLVLADHPEATRTLDVEIVQIVLRKPVDLDQLSDLIRNCVHSVTRRAAMIAEASKSPDQLRS